MNREGQIDLPTKWKYNRQSCMSENDWNVKIKWKGGGKREAKS